MAGLTGRRPSFVPFALALASPFADAALKFSEHAEHLEHGSARRSAGVEGLLMKIQIAI
jgi:hypothetical protein